MKSKRKEAHISNKSADSAPKTPYVFLSHDTRDAETAELFSKLLASVTAGVLKCFRSSDKRGTQGIEYGVEWFPELMKKLTEASDVVCILTENSVNRPWILFEAGVAKGKLETPILGLALGIPLATANTGPFAQFQNSDDEEDSLVKLVTQLVKKIPGAEPDDGVVRSQVKDFKTKVGELLKKKPEKAKQAKEDPATVVKLFEEIKVMFNDLPGRLEAMTSYQRKPRFKGITPLLIKEAMYIGRKRGPVAIFRIMLSLVKEDFPLVYESGMELTRPSTRSSEREMKEMLHSFHDMVELSMNSPMVRDMYGTEYHDVREITDRLHSIAEDVVMYLRDHRKLKAEE